MPCTPEVRPSRLAPLAPQDEEASELQDARLEAGSFVARLGRMPVATVLILRREPPAMRQHRPMASLEGRTSGAVNGYRTTRAPLEEVVRWEG